jgi:hypothetical protein
VDPKIARVLIADHEVAKFVSGGSTATPWIALKAHDRDGDIAIDHRRAFPGNVGDQDILASTLTQFHERHDWFIA